MDDIRVGVIGVGNCASALYQGLTYYKNKTTTGLIRDQIGGYTINNIKVVAAFDVDQRKVGKTMADAILEKPNCTPLFITREEMEDGPLVQMGNVLDGVADHMQHVPELSLIHI